MPPETIPMTPSAMSQMVLFEGEPLTAWLTDEETEFEAFRPYTRRMRPTMSSAMDVI